MSASAAVHQVQEVLAWQVEPEDGSVGIWPAKDFVGVPDLGRWVTPLVAGEQTDAQELLAWHVVFDDGSIELWPAKDIIGVPAFGRRVTALVAGGETVDLAPDQDDD